MSIDLYTPRVMIPALREIKPVRTFLRDTFFSAARTYRTENIDLDQQEKGRRVAPFVNRWAPGKYVDRQGFTTDSIAPPCIAMKMSITAQDVSTRVMGEHIYQEMSPEARGQLILADDLRELMDMLVRREEMMCRDVIFNSSLTVSGLDIAMSFTFTRKAALSIGTLTGSDAWTHADSDPIKQLDAWCETHAKETGLSVTDVIMGGTAYQTFIGNAKVISKMASLTQIAFGQLGAADVPNGVRLVGSLFGGALRLWTYHEWYDDPDNSGVTTAMVPAKKVLLCSRGLRTEMRYGAVQDMPGGETNPSAMPTLVEAVALPRSWVTLDPPVRFLELRSRPLPVPIQNHFLTVQVQA